MRLQARVTSMMVLALPPAGIAFAEVASPGLVGRMLGSPIGVSLVIAERPAGGWGGGRQAAGADRSVSAVLAAAAGALAGRGWSPGGEWLAPERCGELPRRRYRLLRSRPWRGLGRGWHAR